MSSKPNYSTTKRSMISSGNSQANQSSSSMAHHSKVLRVLGWTQKAISFEQNLGRERSTTCVIAVMKRSLELLVLRSVASMFGAKDLPLTFNRRLATRS